MSTNSNVAPGGPGKEAVWTSAAKMGIGASVTTTSQVAFTLGRGIITEVYYPRIDKACIREIQFVITDEGSFMSDEERDCDSVTAILKDGIPAYRIQNNCRMGRYSIIKEIITDPSRSTLLQKMRFTQLGDRGSKMHLYCLLGPHINNKGNDNDGKTGEYKGIPMLFASSGGIALGMACSRPWRRRSVGYLGVSDAYTDLKQHNRMLWSYDEAKNGNILLAGEIDYLDDQEFTLSVGFGRTETEAGNRVHASMLEGFQFAKDRYISEWEDYHERVTQIGKGKQAMGKLFQASTAVLRVSEAKSFPGGLIASLSIPWGTVGGNSGSGGYHLIWSRDLVESCGGLLALGAYDDALRVANYLMSTQEADGKWYQNMWIGGDPYKRGIQMDQVAFPILLIEKCHRHKLLDAARMQQYWPGIKKAIAFLLQEGPNTKQDRWEEQSGLTPFTVAVEVAGLLAAANLADSNEEHKLADYCRQAADSWNSQIEDWTYVTGTAFSRKHNVDGYYIRVNPTGEKISQVKDKIIKVREGQNGEMPTSDLVSADALALVRFGLRAADDPRILNTIKVIDAELRVETSDGPCWHRYNNDGYGEDPYGNPFSGDGKGKGRAWPLLTGERGHYELAAGNISQAKEMMRAMEAFSNNGLLSEQIWDTGDIPEKNLYFGKYTQSAMPLTWAHAEYIKLCCSIQANKVFDMPDYVCKRYVREKVISSLMIWRFEHPCLEIPPGITLRIQTRTPAKIIWSGDEWHTKSELPTREILTGINFADIPTDELVGDNLVFTFFWEEAAKWENENYRVKIERTK